MGKLVGMLVEYVGFINWVVFLLDYWFFIMGGDDGCVKVWDMKCLERMVIYKVR